MSFLNSLEAARNGSRPALDMVLQSCQGYIRVVASRKVPLRLQSRIRPSSLVQETYLKACRDFGHFRGQSERQLLSWLRTIMLRCLINLLRRPEFRITVQALPSDLTGKMTPPAQQVADRESIHALTQALEQLPDHYRAAIELRYFERLSFEEIGRTLGISADAARKVWVRAQTRLAQELQAFL